MKKHLLLAALAACPLLATAQSVFSLSESGGGFYVAPGLYTANAQDQYTKLALATVEGNDAADNARAAVAYPMPSNSMLGAAIGGFGCRSSILFGGELNVYYGAPKSSSLTDQTLATGAAERNFTLKTSALAADVQAQVGVVAFRAAGLVVAPIVGIGYGGSGLFLSDSRANRQYPAYVGTGNQENKFVYNNGLVFDIGLGADYYLGGNKDAAKGFRLGLKVGYRMQSAGTWNATGGGIAARDILNAPIAAPATQGSQGLYLKLVLGVGRVGKGK